MCSDQPERKMRMRGLEAPAWTRDAFEPRHLSFCNCYKLKMRCRGNVLYILVTRDQVTPDSTSYTASGFWDELSAELSISNVSISDDNGPIGTPPILGMTTTSAKFPDFWLSDSELWFLTAESIFRKHRIVSSQTKFDYIVSALSQATVAVVRDILHAPPVEQPYEKLQEEPI